MVQIVSDTAENIVGIGKNAGFYNFLLFPLCFQKATFQLALKVGLCIRNYIVKVFFAAECRRYRSIGYSMFRKKRVYLRICTFLLKLQAFIRNLYLQLKRIIRGRFQNSQKKKHSITSKCKYQV